MDPGPTTTVSHTVLLQLSPVPGMGALIVKQTQYDPLAGNVWIGSAASPVVPSPSDQRYSGAPIAVYDMSKKWTTFPPRSSHS